MPVHGIFGGGEDKGWASAVLPMIVGESTINELRDLAGPPSYPGQKMVQVNLVTGEFQWVRRSVRRSGRRRR